MKTGGFAGLLTTVLFLAALQQCTADSSISVTVRQKGDDRLLPCRAWVESHGERLFNPITKSCTPYKRDRSFSCDGEFVIKVPAGRAVVHVERGKEYYPVNKEVVVPSAGTIDLQIELERWIDMVADG